MRPPKKRLYLTALTFLLIAFLFLLFRQPAPHPNPIAVAFLGYTNSPNIRFALFSITNHARFDIRWRGDWVEIEGDTNYKGRIINPTLPGYKYDPVMKAGQSFIMAVGEPYDASERVPWRFVMSWTRYTFSWRLYDISFRHKIPLSLDPITLVNSPQLINPTNRIPAASSWLRPRPSN